MPLISLEVLFHARLSLLIEVRWEHSLILYFLFLPIFCVSFPMLLVVLQILKCSWPINDWKSDKTPFHSSSPHLGTCAKFRIFKENKIVSEGKHLYTFCPDSQIPGNTYWILLWRIWSYEVLNSIQIKTPDLGKYT